MFHAQPSDFHNIGTPRDSSDVRVMYDHLLYHHVCHRISEVARGLFHNILWSDWCNTGMHKKLVCRKAAKGQTKVNQYIEMFLPTEDNRIARVGLL